MLLGSLMSKKIGIKELKNIVSEQIKKYSQRAYQQNLWESHVSPAGYLSYEKRMYNEYLIKEMFSLDEKEIDSEKTKEVIDLIEKNQYEEVSPKQFLDSLSKSDKPEMLTKYSAGELSKMQLFKLSGNNIGFALKQYTNPVTDKPEFGRSEIVAVHNNEPGVGGIGKMLMKSAISNGGCYLDHFDGFLSKLYKDLGFEEYMRYDFNPDYAPKDFVQKYGKQDVIYRFHPGCLKPNIENESEQSPE
tara:strand:+ start:17 stop:751 length:735 start_codon:yes stop_codon:yes gene_type:complete